MQLENQAPDDLERALGRLGSREEAASRKVNAFDSVALGASNIVIFGCGHLGRTALSGAIDAGLNVVAFADNKQSTWGGAFEGLPVFSPIDAVAKFNDDAVFVVAIYNGTPPRAQLHDLGCKRIVPFPVFYWHFSNFFPSLGLEVPDQIIDRLDEARGGYALLSDRKSRKEFAEQIEWRCTLNYDCLSAPGSWRDTYFPSDLVRLTSEEVLVDCGAFDGDSIRMFLDKTDNSFRHIYAIEPDPQNREALKARIAELPKTQAERVSILPYAVSNRNETVTFNVTGTAGSRITSGGGAISVESRRLDDLLNGVSPTFVKMDIEGAEPDAIEGATETIRRARPILAVCAYHKCEHLWTIPVLMKAALPEYCIFLRRYAEECWETVYYAIPPERLTDGSVN